MAFRIELYIDKKGHCPFEDWIKSLKDKVTIGRILGRLRRFESGNLGDCKYITNSILEHRLDIGPGYRIYFARHVDLLIILGGGDKSTQVRDIDQASLRWQRWKNES